MPRCPCKRKGGSALLPPFNSLALASGSGLREQLVDIFPVDEIIDERLQILWTAVGIIDVVGMLPDVDAEDRGRAMHQRVFAVRRLGDLELAVLHRQPRPARTELADTGGGELALEFLQPAEILGDLLFQAAGQFAAAAVRLHPVPEVQMVVVLAGIVEERRILAERALDDLLEGLALELGALQHIVAVGHIGLMMLVVMVFQRFLRHMGRKRVIGIGQVGKRKGHGVMSAVMGAVGITGTLIEGSIALKHSNFPKTPRRDRSHVVKRRRIELKSKILLGMKNLGGKSMKFRSAYLITA